jgi:hypothetical protein
VLSAALLLVQLSPASCCLMTHPYAALLTYSSSEPRALPHIEKAHWASEPTSQQIAATPAAHIRGGARAMVHCSANAEGKLTGCWVENAEPNRQDVRASALRVTAFYRLDAHDTFKVKLSKKPVVVSLILLLPDRHGTLPSDCSQAIGCIIDYAGPPPKKR